MNQISSPKRPYQLANVFFARFRLTLQKFRLPTDDHTAFLLRVLWDIGVTSRLLGISGTVELGEELAETSFWYLSNTSSHLSPKFPRKSFTLVTSSSSQIIS